MPVIDWKPVFGSPDFVSDGLLAVYKRTDRGHALYWVFLDSTPLCARTQRNALSVGGLPDRLPHYPPMPASEET